MAVVAGQSSDRVRTCLTQPPEPAAGKAVTQRPSRSDTDGMVKKTAAVLLTAAALSAIPAAIIPVAQADICGDFGGRRVTVGGCTPGIAGDAIDAAVAGDWVRYGLPETYAFSLVPAFPGEQPCMSPNGLPYYTPGDAPCWVG